MESLITSTTFLAPISYFAKIINYDEVLIFSEEKFQKQTFRNRANIKTSQGTLLLSVPLKKSEKNSTYNQIVLDNDSNWNTLLSRTITSAYGKSPFFEYYFPYFEPIFKNPPQKLLDLNTETLSICLKLLKSKTKIKCISNLDSDSHEVLALNTVFSENYNSFPYIQVFGNEFANNLSILDLLFCEGTNATNILKRSITF
ncbi:MAG: WbqC family protein [Cytophagales bacterium]